MMLKIGNRRAFTLIELMIAASVLAIGLVGVLGAYTTAISGLEASQHSTNMVCLLKDKMSDVEKEVVQKRAIPPGSSAGEFRDGLKGFKWQVETRLLTFKEEAMQNCLNEVKVVVYNDEVRPPRRFDLTTYAENYEAYYK